MLTGYVAGWEVLILGALGGPPLAALYLLVLGARTARPSLRSQRRAT
ncbi:MAG: hypothetical protein ACRDS0_00840 [Pseudonocardiaceae bacterium]